MLDAESHIEYGSAGFDIRYGFGGDEDGASEDG
jgi:hypothetical protein